MPNFVFLCLLSVIMANTCTDHLPLRLLNESPIEYVGRSSYCTLDSSGEPVRTTSENEFLPLKGYKSFTFLGNCQNSVMKLDFSCSIHCMLDLSQCEQLSKIYSRGNYSLSGFTLIVSDSTYEIEIYGVNKNVEISVTSLGSRKALNVKLNSASIQHAINSGQLGAKDKPDMGFEMDGDDMVKIRVRDA